MRTMKVNHIAKARKRTLKSAGFTYDDLARTAAKYRPSQQPPSWRMVKYWMDDQRVSSHLRRAFDELIARGGAA